MLTLSDDAVQARRELEGLIFYLAAFAAIDGDLDGEELAFIRRTVHGAITARIARSTRAYTPEEHDQQIRRTTNFFDQVYSRVQEEVFDLLLESVSESEAKGAYVRSKLESRCYEVFQQFDPPTRLQLIEAADGLLRADGQVHPAELKLRRLLLSAQDMPVPLPLEAVRPPRRVVVQELPALPHLPRDHPWFKQIEVPYSSDPVELERQYAADLRLVDAARATLARLQQAGAGRLAGHQRVDELSGPTPFLDGHIHVLTPPAQGASQLTVLGDLHGCYSCLKSALMQSCFLERLEDHLADPARTPAPRLVALGDYLDRGRFGLDGVLRALLHLWTAAPNHVFLLRGNHEYLVERNGRVRSGVAPAESIDAIRGTAPQALLQAYRDLFDEMPAALIHGRTLFVHGGIPQDALLRSHYCDLASLNQGLLRFQMMWSDPSAADVIPRALQEESVRFAFGRLQCQAFLERLGCHTLVRGHEQVNEGFRRNYEDERIGLYTLFSAGGADNDADLPPSSSYRRVRPMALTVYQRGGMDGETELEAWPIDYEDYNQPELNGFLDQEPVSSAPARGTPAAGRQHT